LYIADYTFVRREAPPGMRIEGVGTMEILIYIANGMYLVSYSMKDMLHLRVLTVAAALCLVAYFYMRPEPMMTVVCWNLFFIALNVFQIARAIVSRTRMNKNRSAGLACRS
jgi:hypothetical protein